MPEVCVKELNLLRIFFEGRNCVEQTDSIRQIKGIGDKTEQSLNKLYIYTISDLLEHYPRNYDVYEDIVPIQSVKEGEIVAIEAVLDRSIQTKKVRNLIIVTAIVKDYSGVMNLTWFNMPFLQKTIRFGIHYIFRGKVVRKNKMLIMEQPAILSKEEFYNKLHVLTPIYPLTSGVTNKAIATAVNRVLEKIDLTDDYLPQNIRKKYKLITYNQAIRWIHNPSDKLKLSEARKRIVFDEFFIYTLALYQLKKKKGKIQSQYIIHRPKECEQLLHGLPYSLTNAQLKVWREIQEDLSSGALMNRLIQGDVGSGKTIIAALALLSVALQGYQGCIMVPTEVLAKQHYESLNMLFHQFGVRVKLLVGSMTVKEKREAYKQIQEHQVDVIVGTHALIQDKVVYDNLSLVITDEQHRFGVRQREALTKKGGEPHILVMSATPIPRTLAIILYGDLDISVIDELPSNRLPIKNCVVNTNYRSTAYTFIQKEVQNGRQAYVICPMVEESEVIEAENVLEYSEKLKEALQSSIQVEYLHGKMKAKEKNEIMDRFKNNEIQVLVSTTVIEVGVDVPNATVIMIENAERFGLAALHQLRGRVGRGKHQSYCILVSGKNSKETKERLGILNRSNDGFYIANEDLKLRGPGDMFGLRQSGLIEFKLGDIYNDAQILKDANDAAMNFTKEELYELSKKNPALYNKIVHFSGEILL